MSDGMAVSFLDVEIAAGFSARAATVRTTIPTSAALREGNTTVHVILQPALSSSPCLAATREASQELVAPQDYGNVVLRFLASGTDEEPGSLP
jgi:hypothetical protein